MISVALDPSALVAIALRESDHVNLSAVVLDEACAVTAPGLLDVYRVLRGRGISDIHCEQYSAWLLEEAQMKLYPFDQELLSWAQLGFERFGARAGQGAALSESATMSYALANHLAVPLLFTKGRFRETDVLVHPASRFEPGGAEEGA